MTPLAFQTTPKYRSGAGAIDWSHPITRGMFDCLLWNDGAGAPVNLCPGTAATTLTSAPTLGMTVAGPAGYATGGSSFDIPDHGSLVAGDSAVRILFLPVSWPNAFTVLIDKGNPTGSHREICLFFGTTGDISFACYGNDGGASLAISTGCAAGLVWDFVASKSGNTVTYYVNGVSKGTGASAGTAHLADPMCYGRNISGGGANADVMFIAAQNWTRALDVSEVLDLYHNPYGFLLRPENTLPALKSASGGFFSRYYYMGKAA